MTPLLAVKRRYKRMLRRKKVGRAYDMALEIARVLKPGSEVLDVGCGSGFIAHHLKGMLGSSVVGLDVGENPAAPIDYVPYDGRHFPIADNRFDAVLLCYVLHHAQDARLVLEECRRVLRYDRVVIVYEDNPGCWWDRAVCWGHNLQWKSRTGPCTFRLRSDWRKLFNVAGFKVLEQRELSRWRNLAHPVSRSFFVLKVDADPGFDLNQLQLEPLTLNLQQQIRAST